MQKHLGEQMDHSLIESGYFNHLDFRMVEWEPGLAVLEIEIGPQHLNRAKTLHGGVLTAMIDTVCGFSGCHCSVPGYMRKAVTLSLTTSFTGQVSSGIIRAVGRKRTRGRKIFVSSAEVFNAADEIIAIGEATYRYRSGSEDSSGQPV
ncbi:PaaI family thioesterase [Geopsychrobacter electrodiphilus]|uniref:PaaI family thioesterase n=1 Tax=Geopsychrobacter electrodiphilus TaxID=225196 RepID=UPI001B7F8693|nr:PaaI family thioesterase [Geopsychrobacter electrodiphilus]